MHSLQRPRALLVIYKQHACALLVIYNPILQPGVERMYHTSALRTLQTVATLCNVRGLILCN